MTGVSSAGQRRGWTAGSFTVEAALLFSVLIPLLVGLIYAVFYLHDRVLLEGAVCETAARYSLILPDKRSGAQLSPNALLEGRMLGTREISVEIQAGEKDICVRAGGNFTAPGIAAPFFSGQIAVSQCWERSIIDAAGIIRKVRGIGNLLAKEE